MRNTSSIVTDVCVTFVPLSAKKAGYEVFVVADASGAFSEAVNEASWLRMQQVGIQLMNWFGFACELGRDWRKDINGMAALSATNAYLLMLMDSFAGAQAAAKTSSLITASTYDTLKFVILYKHFVYIEQALH
ncbi:hypothetical protein [Parasitella parasitica]|uniref:Isochorismatase-like domain-containing protein n=1 Tax=Parasitella parasitica TaxID=35722 RepID=A0A0B7NH13_9FUNG|nr:hypothetical protein [Parasitella parasitica]